MLHNTAPRGPTRLLQNGHPFFSRGERFKGVGKTTHSSLCRGRLTHCGRVTQICVFNTVKLGTSASSPQCHSTRRNISRGITPSSTTRVFGKYFLKISVQKSSQRICYKFLKKHSIKVDYNCLNPGNGRLNNLNDPVLNVLIEMYALKTFQNGRVWLVSSFFVLRMD